MTCNNLKTLIILAKDFHVMNNQPESGFNADFIGRKQLGEMLTHVRLESGMTRDDVIAKSKTGFSRSSLQAWESGEREPKLDNLYDLARLYGVHPWQLISGDTSHVSAPSTQVEEVVDDEYAYIPAYDVEVSAGNGSVCLGEAEATKHLAFRKHWLTARGLQTKSLAALFTKGDSMTPTIPESAVVVINREQIKPLDGKVYVIRIEDRHYVKRIQWLIGGGLRLISDNKFYDPLDVTKDDMIASNIEICGQVIHASYDLPN